MSAARSGSALALGDVINEGLKTREDKPQPPVQAPAPEPPPAPVPAVPAPAAMPVAKQPEPAPDDDGDEVEVAEIVPGWTGTAARPKVRRRQLNVGLPEDLDLHYRLQIFNADTGVDVQDVVAEAIHEKLTALGYPLRKRRRRRR